VAARARANKSGAESSGQAAAAAAAAAIRCIASLSTASVTQAHDAPVRFAAMPRADLLLSAGNDACLKAWTIAGLSSNSTNHHYYFCDDHILMNAPAIVALADVAPTGDDSTSTTTDGVETAIKPIPAPAIGEVSIRSQRTHTYNLPKRCCAND
jgi:hypothetical protein